MIIEIANYQIRPYNSGLCWQLWQYRKTKDKNGENERSEWLPMDTYPSTLENAFEIIRGKLARNSSYVKQLDEAIDVLESLNQRLMQAIKDAKE